MAAEDARPPVPDSGDPVLQPGQDEIFPKLSPEQISRIAALRARAPLRGRRRGVGRGRAGPAAVRRGRRRDRGPVWRRPPGHGAREGRVQRRHRPPLRTASGREGAGPGRDARPRAGSCAAARPRPDRRRAERDLPARLHSPPPGPGGAGQGQRGPDRLGPFRGHSRHPGVPDPQQPAVHLRRRGPRPGGPGDAGPLRGQRGRRAGPHLSRHAGPPQTDHRGGGGVPRAQPGQRSRRPRPRRHRRGTRRPGRRGVRGLGRARRPGAGGELPGRPGRLELAHRELPRLPHRNLGPAPRRPRIRAGGEVRGGVRGGARGREAGLRPAPATHRPGRGALRPGALRHHRHGRAVPEARPRGPPSLRGTRCLLRGHAGGGRLLPRRGRDRGGGRELRGPGGGVPGEPRPTGGHAGEVGRPGRQHVALSHPPNRGDPEHQPADARADRSARGRRSPRARHLARRRRRPHDHRRSPRLPDDRGRPEHGLARRLRGAGRERLREDGSRPLAGRAGGCCLALDRRPLLFETSLPAVFAVGDVRANSVKRVAAAVGEGSVCVQLVHKILAE